MVLRKPNYEQPSKLDFEVRKHVVWEGTRRKYSEEVKNLGFGLCVYDLGQVI